jgi:hypothetical protein
MRIFEIRFQGTSNRGGKQVNRILMTTAKDKTSAILSLYDDYILVKILSVEELPIKPAMDLCVNCGGAFTADTQSAILCSTSCRREYEQTLLRTEES